MSYFFQRDITTNNAPADNQIGIGELKINAKTGILYSKRTDGKIVRFLSIPIDDNSPGNDLLTFVPIIRFSDTTNFCCNGDTITVTVDNLLVGNNYTFQVGDMVVNSTTYFSALDGGMSPISSSSRQVSINISVSSVQYNALIKFSVLKDGVVLSENVKAICCANCTS